MPTAQAFLYAPGLTEAKLQQLWSDPASLTVEHVDFPADGGASDLLLAIPYLPDMDEIVVTEAELQIRAETYRVDLDVTEYTASAHPDGGVILELPQPGRLVGVVVESEQTILRSGENDHLVISTAEPGRPGAPLVSYPDFTPPSPMYPRPLTGLDVTTVPGGASLTVAEPLQGSRWAIQVGDGDTASTLTSRAIALRVRSVSVDQAPRALRVVIPADPATGGTETILYANPDVLLPAADVQRIGFVPLAQRQLTARLEAARTASPGVTLPIPLRIASESAGRLDLISRSLAARYTVKPLAADPFKFLVGGAWNGVTLAAPAARRPMTCDATIVATHLGRRLDDGSQRPPLADPAAGVVASPDRWVAASIPFGGAGRQSRDLASVRVFVAADSPVEAVVELRSDGTGVPGDLLASIVGHVPKAPGAWIEFELPQPLAVDVPATLWCVLRTNDGPLRWFAAPDGSAPMLSTDRGGTWGDVATTLGSAAAPLLQLYRRVQPGAAGEPDPEIEVYLDSSRVATLALQPTGTSAAAFQAPLTLPDRVLGAMAATTGPGRRDTVLMLYSASVMDVQVRGLACSYDPFGQ